LASGAIPRFFGTVWVRSGESEKGREEVAVLGGCSERVSDCQIP
jgi:hypothetical protein